MSVQISLPRAAVRLLLLAAAPVLFVACTADQNPSPMPTGYKYHNRQYVVSSAGPVQPKVYPGEYGQAPAAAPMGLQPSSGEMVTAMAPVPVASAPVMEPAPMMAPIATTTTSTTTSSTTITNAPVAAPVAMDSIAAAPQWKSAAADLLTKTEHDFGRLQDPVYVRDAINGQAGEPAFRQALTEVLAERHYKTATDKKMAPFAFDYSVGAPAPTGKSPLSLTVMSQAKPIITEKGDYDLRDGAPVAPAPVASAPVASAPVATSAAIATPVAAPAPEKQAGIAPAPDTMSPTPAPPAPAAQPAAQPAAMAVSGAQKPVIVTGPGSAPPPPSASMSSAATPAGAVSTPSPEPAPTYVYDGRSTNAPGRTAYEQREGVNRQIDMASPDDEGTAR